MSSVLSRWTIRLSRFGLAGWIVVEVLNWIGVLHFHLSFTWAGLVITASFIWIVIELLSRAVRRRTGKGLTAWVYLLGFVGISLDALGDILRWYITFHYYDKVLHTISGGFGVGIIALNVLWRLRQAGRLTISFPFVGFFSWTSASLVGTLYEIEEYLEDVINHTPGRRLGDGPDTASDLLWNVVGSGVMILIVTFVLWRRQRYRPVSRAEGSA